jgi:tetratricopeptide (TPR) repeat protein
MNDLVANAVPAESQDADIETPPIRRFAFAVLLVAAGLLAYENSMSGVFTLDDIPCIVNNESLRSLDATWNAGPDDIPGGLNRRVVGRWTFALNFAAGGLNVWGYHLVNIVIHITAALLLMGIVRRVLLLPRIPSALREQAALLAFCAALLWLVHPIQTESVTYIVQRLESLMGMFFLASLYALLRSRDSRTVFWQSLAVITGGLCIGTKEVGLMLPLVALLFDRVFLGSSWSEVLSKRGIVHALLLTAMVGYLLIGIGSMPLRVENQVKIDEAVQRATSWEFLRTQPGVLLHYLKITFWPKSLCLELNWPIAHDPLEIYGKGALIVATLIGGFALLRSRPVVGFLIVTFFLILAPSSTIVPLFIAFEHRMYLSLGCVAIGVVFAVFWFGQRLSQRFGLEASARSGAICVLLVCVPAAMALTFLTRQHNETYRDSIAVWQNVVRVAPHNVRAHMNLGVYLGKAGRYDEAESHFRYALDHKPTYHACWYNLGQHQHRDQKSPQDAVASFRKAVELNPGKDIYHFALASALADSGDTAAAEASYRRTLEINSDHYEPHHNLGRLLRKEGRLAEAEQLLKRAIELSPVSWRTQCQLAKLRINQGNSEGAKQHYEDAFECFEDEPPWVLNQQLAWLLATSPDDTVRDGERAVKLAQLAVDAQTSQPICWDTLGVAQAEIGLFDDAIESTSKAAALPESSTSTTHSLAAINQRIDLFRQGRKYRAPDVNSISVTNSVPNGLEGTK